jgi:nitroreductase
MSKAMRDVLDLARWAPSGDNTQPWRFSIEADDRIAVHAFDTRHDCVYDLDGHASQLSVGALLETLAIAATRFGWTTEIERREGTSDERPVFDVRLRDDVAIGVDPLADYIVERRVQRRPLSTRRLTKSDKRALEAAVAPRFAIRWLEAAARAKAAWLNFANAKIRLTIPEAYAVHRDVIEWNAHSSEARIPAAALGASGPSLALMRWAMASWQRVDALNRFAAGTLAPRVELDLVPGLACAAHAAIVAPGAPRTLDDYVAAGRALQRFWLTATSLGLQFQPEYTPLVFARYAREGVRFSMRERALRRARGIAARLDRLLGADVAPRVVFLGRIGEGRPAQARSLRLPLERLLEPVPERRAEGTADSSPGNATGSE